MPFHSYSGSTQGAFKGASVSANATNADLMNVLSAILQNQNQIMKCLEQVLSNQSAHNALIANVGEALSQGDQKQSAIITMAFNRAQQQSI